MLLFFELEFSIFPRYSSLKFPRFFPLFPLIQHELVSCNRLATDEIDNFSQIEYSGFIYSSRETRVVDFRISLVFLPLNIETINKNFPTRE